ncbi:DUF4173 domain-containing protein [Lachnospiraceae bacterium]|nr:DUF4173 domain-containing protein [Lachnospiraceae bacterium]
MMEMENKEMKGSQENMETDQRQREHFQDNSQTVQIKSRQTNPVMRKNARFFLIMALIYSVCFAAAFYRNYIGITFPLITAATLAVCGLFLKKNNIPWKNSNWCYLLGCILLGVSTFLTTNIFIIFFNTVGILLLITVFMLHQVYDDSRWGFGQYLVNMMFLYLNMIPEVASPFIHLADYLKKGRKFQRKNKTVFYILLGILIGLPMMILVIALLSSADQIFSNVVGDLCYKLWRQILFSPNVFLVLFLMILGFFGIYSFLSALTLNNMPQWNRQRKKQNPVIAITFLSMVTVVYLIFCVIQVVFLFTGGLLLPEGYTYAAYARQGFFQLLFVCLFNLILALCAISLFEMNKILKALLLLCSGCTYIMIASSVFRMFLYIDTYHLSFLRVLVLWFLAMLVLLMAGVVRTVLKPEFGLFRYSMTVVTVCYLVFSCGRPDVLVAEYNMAHLKTDISYEDMEYLADLSIDTLPVLSRYDFEHENCNRAQGEYVKEYDYYEPVVIWNYDNLIGRTKASGCRRCLLNQRLHEVLEDTKDMNARTFHLSRYLARKAAKESFAIK